MKKLMVLAFTFLFMPGILLLSCDDSGSDKKDNGNDTAQPIICHQSTVAGDVYTVYPAAYTTAESACTSAGGSVVTEIDDSKSYCKTTIAAGTYTASVYTEITDATACSYIPNSTFIDVGEANSDAGISTDDPGDDDPGDDDPGDDDPTDPSSTKVCGFEHDGVTTWSEFLDGATDADCTDAGGEVSTLDDILPYCSTTGEGGTAYVTGTDEEECTASTDEGGFDGTWVSDSASTKVCGIEDDGLTTWNLFPDGVTDEDCTDAGGEVSTLDDILPYCTTTTDEETLYVTGTDEEECTASIYEGGFDGTWVTE